jgi:ligand-binding sensor domain-containing protein
VNRESVTNGQWPNGSITGLAVADDGSVWIGSDQAQICQFDPGAGQCANFFTNAEGMAIAPLTSLRIGEEDEVYYTTAGAGISMYSGGRWKQMVVTDEIVPGNQIRSLAADDAGLLWIGANGGAAQMDPATDERELIFSPANSPLPSSDVRVVFPVGAAPVWFGAGGASYFDGENWTNYTVADGLAGPDVQAITADGQNRTWFGTRTGLSIWTGATFFNLTSENGLPSYDITALLAEGDIVWIGTRAGLLRFQDNQLQVFNTENIGLPSNVITALRFDAAGAVLVGTDAGLARLAENQAELVEDVPAAPITALTTAPEGEIWVAAGGAGLYHFDGEGWGQMTDTANLPSSEITALLVDPAGDLWIGCALGGLARLTFTE